MTALARRAEGTGVTLVHENEKDIFGDVPSRVSDIIETVNSPALKVAWDPANFVQVGVKPFTEAYELLRPHLVYLQVKDALFADGRVVPAGEGDGEVQRTVEALRDSGYTGFASLEPHLAQAFSLGGYSGPYAFGVAARAFAKVLDAAGVAAV
jgi:sugar phosphate isomerase/epimerase